MIAFFKETAIWWIILFAISSVGWLFLMGYNPDIAALGFLLQFVLGESLLIWRLIRA